MRRTLLCVGAVLMLANATRALAQQTQDVNELSKATQNPVSDLTTVPFQFNFNSGGDLGDQTLLNLNLQPVVPFKLSADWNMIARTIIPINSIPGPDQTRFSGLGDFQQQLYITPSKPGKIIWGAGPMFWLPTATASPLETGSWGMGPGLVVLRMSKKWVYGALAQQFWTIEDSGGDPSVNLFVLQYFVNYNFGQGWAIGSSPILSANWDAADGDQWTVPVGLGISRTTVFDRRPIQLAVQYYYNVEHPSGTGGQLLRFVVSLLYPRTPKA